MVGLGEEGKAVLDEELRGMAGDVTRKHGGAQPGEKHPFDDEEEEEENKDDGDGSTFKDVNEVVSAPAKKAGKAKSPAKLAPTTNKWTVADLDTACQNRYNLDLAKMMTYHRNYLSATDKMTFNLKDHSKYLDIILSQPGIMQDMVFTKEAGHQYFVGHNILPVLYDQGLLKPLPQSSSS